MCAVKVARCQDLDNRQLELLGQQAGGFRAPETDLGGGSREAAEQIKNKVMKAGQGGSRRRVWPGFQGLSAALPSALTSCETIG